jgi:hypothetical protein
MSMPKTRRPIQISVEICGLKLVKVVVYARERVSILPTNVEGGGSSRDMTRLHTMIGLNGYRTRDLLRIRRALYRLTEKA